MSETTDIQHDMGIEAFFSIVNGEILVWEAFQRELQAQGSSVGVGRFIPLHYLANGPLRLQELVGLTHAKESAASRLVERMVKDGLVEKRRDECDGRAILLHITDEGRRIEAEGRDVFARCVDEMFADLSTDELRMLCSLIDRVKLPGESTVRHPRNRSLDACATSLEQNGRVASAERENADEVSEADA